MVLNVMLILCTTVGKYHYSHHTPHLFPDLINVSFTHHSLDQRCAFMGAGWYQGFFQVRSKKNLFFEITNTVRYTNNAHRIRFVEIFTPIFILKQSWSWPASRCRCRRLFPALRSRRQTLSPYINDIETIWKLYFYEYVFPALRSRHQTLSPRFPWSSASPTGPPAIKHLDDCNQTFRWLQSNI